MTSHTRLYGKAPVEESQCSLLNQALDGGLSIVFQPIFEIRNGIWRLHSLECLTRGPKGTELESADMLFECVRREQEEIRTDRVCIQTALRAAKRLPCAPQLSINVHASTLELDPDFPAFLERAARESSIPLARLTIEIVEHVPFWDGTRFLEVLDALRRFGIRVAMDDFGMGHSNYRMILCCKPDYFKIDRSLVSGACENFYQRAVLESVSQLARKVGARVVAEGVEETEDLSAVMSLGINLVQGYLFAPPLTEEGLLHSDLLEDHRGRPTLPLPETKRWQESQAEIITD